MRILTEVRLGLGALLVLQLLTTLGAVGLLQRTGPAVARILDENVASIRAVEDMAMALVLADSQDEDLTLASFREGLARARSNITEEDERGHIAVLERQGAAAVAGDITQVRPVSAALSGLSEVNHASMRAADERARRLAYGGAWAIIGSGSLSLLIGVLLARRLQLRLAAPLAEIVEALEARRGGNPHRRAAVREAPAELVQVAREVNLLLDGRRALQDASPAPDVGPALHRLLLSLLDDAPSPVVVLGADGTVLAQNQHAFALLAGVAGEERLRELRAGSGHGWHVDDGRVPGLRWARWSGAAPDSPPAEVSHGR
jgi:nitrogen fixation/metabolism regulation signal transduction histidine kinase